jgi:hypothetical protein
MGLGRIVSGRFPKPRVFGACLKKTGAERPGFRVSIVTRFEIDFIGRT